ncbi:hypothetical protein [Hamadaea tsunoensis]|uniref:hypothetical protein n=1 Tax=Hamadaea tsunoensis TaxID=53368 RepID=UPI00040694BC|nr:hypothetical protein [Hamadaea tsunoensis]
MSKRNQRHHDSRQESHHQAEHQAPTEASDPAAQHGYPGEHAHEQAKQNAMAARGKATRTQMSVGQANIMRLKKGNQPRGSR